MRLLRGTIAALLLLGTGAVAASDAAVQPAGPCANPTIVGTAQDDTLVGTTGPDVIAGGKGNDRIEGGDGDDLICGGDGSDTLLGGPGNDALHGESDERYLCDNGCYEFQGDRLSGGPGDDLLDPGLDSRSPDPHDSVTWADSRSPVTVDLAAATATGDGTDTIVGELASVIGSPFDDTLLGSDGDDGLQGGAGADHLDGRAGNDVLEAAGGLDDDGNVRDDRDANLLVGGPGRDALSGSRGDDTLRGGPGQDSLWAYRGRDRLFGGPGDDSIGDHFEPGDGQSIVGGAGRDQLNDAHLYSDGGRYLHHARGTIDLRSGTMVARSDDVVSHYRLIGMEDVTSPAGDRWTIFGTDGPNLLMAGSDDTAVRIYAGAGADQLWGSFRDDVLHGGPGHDSGGGWTGDDEIQSVEKLYR